VRKTTTGASGQTIGLDLGDRWSQICMLDEEGRILDETRVATRPAALRAWFGKQPQSRVALEVGTHSPWVSRLLEVCGHEVLTANARKLRFIFDNDSKSDRADARLLARVARLDPQLLSPIHHRSEQAQADRSVLRSRDELVRCRASLIGHVRGMVKSTGMRLPSSSTPGFVKRVSSEIPASLQPALHPILKAIEALTEQIRALERRVLELENKYPATGALQQVSGVGSITSLNYVLTIEDPHRFRRSRALGSYIGLRPRRDQSGARDPQLHITKAGDPLLRRHLVQSAQYILGPFGPDSDLRRKGLEIAARGGKASKKRAVVAVARQLAVLLHHLWVTGEVYEPLHNTMRRGAVQTVEAAHS